jgi:hypothetical protein
MQQFLAVIPEERAADRHEAGREFVLDSMAGRAHFLMRPGRPGQPLPVPVVKYRAALRTNRGLMQLVLGLVGIVPEFLDQAIVPDRREAGKTGFHFQLLSELAGLLVAQKILGQGIGAELLDQGFYLGQQRVILVFIEHAFAHQADTQA